MYAYRLVIWVYRGANRRACRSWTMNIVFCVCLTCSDVHPSMHLEAKSQTKGGFDRFRWYIILRQSCHFKACRSPNAFCHCRPFLRSQILQQSFPSVLIGALVLWKVRFAIQYPSSNLRKDKTNRDNGDPYLPYIHDEHICNRYMNYIYICLVYVNVYAHMNVFNVYIYIYAKVDK